jgi:uncharacterized protein (DUF1330 family)
MSSPTKGANVWTISPNTSSDASLQTLKSTLSTPFNADQRKTLMIRLLTFARSLFWLTAGYVALVMAPLAAQPSPPAPPSSPSSPSLQVQTNGPGYLLVVGRSFDRAKVIAYSAVLPPIYAETGGRYIGQGRPGGGVTCLYGLCEGRSAVVPYWPDQKSIEAFWWGESYRKAIRLRDGAGVFTVVGIRGSAGVVPYAGGALLIATASSATEPASTGQWLEAAAKFGARLLAPFASSALVGLEGDAPYSRVAMLSFETKDKRDQFATSDETKALIKSAPPLSLLSLIAIDAPPPQLPPSTPVAPR